MVTYHYHSCAQEDEAGGAVSSGTVQATWTDPAFTVKLTQSSLLLGYCYKREDPKDGRPQCGRSLVPAYGAEFCL